MTAYSKGDLIVDALTTNCTTALEKAARAILAELPRFVGEPEDDPDYIVSYIDCGEVDLRDLARAVLLAVLPTLERYDAGYQSALGDDGVLPTHGGTYVRFADLQAILSEPKP